MTGAEYDGQRGGRLAFLIQIPFVSAPAIIAIVEQITGGLLLFLVLLDVFMTVLYARMDSGIVSRRLGKAVAWAFRGLARRHSSRGGVLRFCGPAILVLLVFVWSMMLACGTALLIQPRMGEAVRAPQGPTPTDFLSALYIGGSSVATIGSSGFVPTTRWFRMLFLFDSLTGLSILSLTLTYIMQIYTALQRRNSLALSFYLLTSRTSDAAKLVAALGPEGRFEGGYTIMASLAAESAGVKESHHFYPIMFYFRFEEPFYSVSAYTLLALDAITLIDSALSERKYGWMRRSAAVVQLREASLALVSKLEEAFLRAGKAEAVSPDARTRERWKLRYRAALRHLDEAGIETAEDAESGAEAYVRLRTEWDNQIRRLAPFMLHNMEEIDPVGSHPERPLSKTEGPILRT